jgi:CHASE3 domain sensor protein
MDGESEYASALTEARLEIDRIERELQQSGARPPEVRRYLITRLELARRRVQRLLAT